ncbi:DUF1793-domain-containing protein [Mycena latifolia]|nr:DUF1793-domain-containing protein [Mycena latifolia]
MRPHRFLLPFGLLQLWSSWSLAQQTFFPPAVPLAVRSPTFNCWLDTRNGSNPMTTWPQFWNDQHILGWAGYIKVDGAAFHWLGSPVPGNASTWISTEVTPTRTIVTVQAGPMLLNVTFLSPVEPADWARQSFPFSYVYLDGRALDGKFHSIQLYSDISAEWVTNSFGTSIQWSTGTTENTVYHKVQSSNPTSVFKDVAEDSVAYYAMASNQPGRVSIIGTDQQLRAQFVAGGSAISLTSDLAASFGNVDNNGKFPVFAHAVDLGETSTISSVAWAVGVVRDPVLTYAGVQRRSYFWSQYSTVGDAIDAFVSDFPAAQARSLALDQKILEDALGVSQEYADLVSLATRQAMAGVEITLSQTAGGEWNMSDAEAFMKDVGNSQRVNPTEAIYAALPALMYLNASISGLLIEPLLRFQSSPAYTNPYAASDLGTPYPSAPGNANDQSVYGVENSGDMLILVLAHASASGDGSLMGKYYNLLKKWADYLVSNALIPAQQTSADARDTSLAQNHGNITNLAIKGIIAIQAMSEMSQIMGQTADAQQYATSAKTLVQSWVNLTSSSGSLRWTYGSDSSFGLMYNFLPDRLLQLNVVPPSIYAAESTTLTNPALKAQQPFGFTLSSDSDSNTRSDWALFSAAAAPDTSTRNLLISAVHQRASANNTAGPFSNLYSARDGSGIAVGVSPNGFATPAQGAMFSVLSLNVPNITVIVPSPAGSNSSPSPSGSSSPVKAHNNAGAIAGGVIGGLAVICVLGLLALFLRRRRQAAGDELAAPQPYHSEPAMANFSLAGDEPRAPEPYYSDSPMTNFGGYAAAAPTHPSSRTSSHVQDRSPSPFPFVVPSSKGASSNLGTESNFPVSQPASVSAPSSTSRGTQELRAEMDNLRREVEQLRAAQDGIPQEAPPVYQ